MTKPTALTEESENAALKRVGEYDAIPPWGGREMTGSLGDRDVPFLTARERDRITQWVSLAQPVLARFHVRLECVTENLIRRTKVKTESARETFIDSKTESRFIVSTALTALGTYLFGGHGEAFEKSKAVVNELKKKADAVSAYILSEALYFSTRELRENHGVLVNLGEGGMPKCGETPEQGANPQIAFGRIFARQDVAMFLQSEVRKLLDPQKTGTGWHAFQHAIDRERLHVWGAVIDSLENTSRFSNGETTGPMVVMHVFDQPLMITGPYECYMGTLTVPEAVVRMAQSRSIAIHYLMPRVKLFEAIQAAYPDLRPRNVHVWTLRGRSRQARLGSLWREWEDLGVNLVDSSYTCPGASAPVFNDSGTYAPVYQVGAHEVNGERHLFLVDGYASSAEAVQAASLDPARGQRTFLCTFTPEFHESPHQEGAIMRLAAQPDKNLEQMCERLSEILNRPVAEEEAARYNQMLRTADRANMPRRKDNLTIEDFLPNRAWKCAAFSAPIFDDPYSGLPGIRKTGNYSYSVCVRIAHSDGSEKHVTLTLSVESDKARESFSPLLDRLYGRGSKSAYRPVKTSDVGRILNELRTWCWNCVTDRDGGGVVVNLDAVDDLIMSLHKRQFAMETLARYKRDYPSLAGHIRLEGRLSVG